MDLGIVTIAYGGYGQFLPQWCKSISELDIAPSATTVVLGQRHGLTGKDKAESLRLLPGLKIINDRSGPTMGRLRNLAVQHTDTEWIQYLSVDDIILPWAIDEYQRYEADADYIVIRWKSRATWNPEAPEYDHTPRTPYEMAKKYDGRGFLVNHSPYRRSFWARRPYMLHDYPNAPFIAGMVELGARFVRTERPCTVYLRRLDSHCGRNLGRRQLDGKKRTVPAEKRLARYWRADMQRRICNYYEGK